MVTQILAPLDGSELAECALPCAARLASAMGATLHLVRVVEPPAGTVALPGPLVVPEALDGDTLERQMREATAYLEVVRTRLATTRSGIVVRTARPTGAAGATLCRYEREAGIDLVVMCSRGRSGLARWALGSVTDHVLRHGTAPVLMVRAGGRPVTLQQALVPLDGSTRAEAALPLVNVLAGTVIREVTVLMVIAEEEQRSVAERYLEEAARHLHGDGLTCWRQVELGDPAAVIIDAAGTEKLVVMATHGRSGLARGALGSVADHVARHGGAEVLLVRASAGAPHLRARPT